jgi:acetylglutamate/LysW-gamma-L-alpha-aminoadipate kinase
MINVLKIGGGAGIDPSETLRNLAERIRVGERWVLVHGASDAANTLAAQMGVIPQTLTGANGHTSRYTDAAMIEIFCAAAGSVNTRMTAGLASFGVVAAGVSGVSVLNAERKTAIRALINGRQVIIRDDFSGALTHANVDLLQALLEAGMTPVISPIALGSHGERLNVDGDLAAALIAGALNADSLIILSNVPGLLRDVNDPHSLITDFSAGDLPRYESFAQGRMKKKLIAADRATANGVARVILSDARPDAPLDAALNGAGTHIWSDKLKVKS